MFRAVAPRQLTIPLVASCDNLRMGEEYQECEVSDRRVVVYGDRQMSQKRGFFSFSEVHVATSSLNSLAIGRPRTVATSMCHLNVPNRSRQRLRADMYFGHYI